MPRRDRPAILTTSENGSFVASPASFLSQALESSRVGATITIRNVGLAAARQNPIASPRAMYDLPRPTASAIRKERAPFERIQCHAWRIVRSWERMRPRSWINRPPRTYAGPFIVWSGSPAPPARAFDQQPRVLFDR